MSNPTVSVADTAHHKIKVFIPFHSDFSQLETCAPFLDRYGGVILIYAWNTAMEAITKHYEQQYPDGWVKVIRFSLRNILYAIQHLDHRITRSQALVSLDAADSASSTNDLLPQVVFLLMASMNPDYGAFGLTQKRILDAVKDALPDRVYAVNIIGHCMYGCASCSGIEHKVPLYFTRYFNKSLPYTAEDVLKEYCPANTHALPATTTTTPKNVLVAPSCGSTSIIAQRPLIQLFHRLEQSGQFKFLWKLHPTSLQMEDYDLTDVTGVEQAEYENVQFILGHFAVTREEHACLLPFMEAFDVVVTDLHSSVPFIATYFTPKVILSYFNDADYGSPERHQEFMDQLNTFIEPHELEQLLMHLPAPKGDPSFFHSQYGHVDGQEDFRFGQLAKWPNQMVRPLKPFHYRKTMADLAVVWKAIYQEMVAKYDDVEGANNALGFKADVALLKGTVDPPLVLPQSLPSNHPHPPMRLSILSYNIWNGGFSGGQPLTQTAKVILDSGADIVGLQECSKPPEVGADKREYILPALMKLLPGWHSSDQKLNTTGLKGVWAIISRHPIVEVTPEGHGAKIQLPQVNGFTTPRYCYLFNTHLYYYPYQPFQLLHIPYDRQPFLNTADEAIASATAARGWQLDSVLQELQAVARADPHSPIFFTGDFNEPSHLDWTPLTALAGLHPLSVAWPMTRRLYEAGLVDLWRGYDGGASLSSLASLSLSPSQENHPTDVKATTRQGDDGEDKDKDKGRQQHWGLEKKGVDEAEWEAVARPGLTWTCLRNELDLVDHYDRIDFIFALGRESSPVALDQAPVKIGEEFGRVGERNDKVLAPWPSDHRAILAHVLI